MFLLNDFTHRMLMRYHPLVGHLHVPNLVARVPHESGGFLVRTNSLGFRSDLEFKDTLGKRPRILVFGDSYTAGEGCDNQQRYAELLGRDLDAEVYNYGVSGTAPDQHLLMYQEFGKHTDADLIIWGISVHTIERAQLKHRPSIDRATGKPILVPKPYFTVEKGQLVLHHVPVPRSRPGLNEPSESQNVEGRQVEPPLLKWTHRSRMMAALRSLAKRSLPGFKDHLRGLAYRIADVQLYDDYLDKRSVGWSLLAAIIKRFRMEAEGTPVLIVPLPTYHYYVDRLRPAYQQLYDSLEDPSRDLFVCNISDELHQGKSLAERKSLCFEGDGHYSPYGHREVARLIAADIRKRRLLPNRSDSTDRTSFVNNQNTDVNRCILGLAFGAGDSAAALVRNGEIIAAARESSFTRIENQSGFPHQAVNYCLEEASIGQCDLSAVAYGGAPSSELRRDALALRSTADKLAWQKIMANWVLNDLNTYPEIRSNLQHDGLLLESSHSTAQCAATFYPSPFSTAAIISFHGAAQRANACIGIGDKEELKLLKEAPAPHNLQLFYLAMTRIVTGQTVNTEAGLWRQAQPGKAIFVRKIFDELVDLKSDGSIELNPDYFSNPTDIAANDEALEKLLGVHQRKGHENIMQMANLARSAQLVICDSIVRMARYAHNLTGQRKLCVSGELIHDPEVQRALLQHGSFDDVWFQPLTGSANAALGAALTASFAHFHVERTGSLSYDSRAAYGLLGPAFSTEEIDAFVDTYDYPSEVLDSAECASRLATIIADGKVVGHFSGRLGVPPENAGDRLILMDTRRRKAASSFYSNNIEDAPGMELVVTKPASKSSKNSERKWHQFEMPGGGLKWAHAVSKAASPGVYNIIREFEAQTGYGAIPATPLKLPLESAACTPLDAYRCFMQSEMDVLALGNRLLIKSEQPHWPSTPVEAPSEPNRKSRMAEEKFTTSLGLLYETKCKTAAQKIRCADETESSSQFKESKTCWNKSAEKNDHSLVSEVDVSLEQLNSSPRCQALAIVSKWEPGVLREQFRKILVELTRLRKRLAN